MPSAAISIVVDANILISAVLGRAARLTEFRRVAGTVPLLTTDEVIREATGVVRHVRPEAMPAANGLFALVRMVPVESLGPLRLVEAARFLQRAPQSGNGLQADAHVLALADIAEADIWTHDRDFAGTGIPTWSTANLMAALGLDDP